MSNQCILAASNVKFLFMYEVFVVVTNKRVKDYDGDNLGKTFYDQISSILV